MGKVRVFVSFDLDHDNDCKSRFVAQATDNRSPFEVNDWSIREVAKDWEDKVRKRISNVDQLIVICGEHTDTATSVNTEITLAREAGRPYILLEGRHGRSRKPIAALETDEMYDWAWADIVDPS